MTTQRPIHEIAQEIRQNWTKVNYAAEPYLHAMQSLSLPSDSYYFDSAQSILIYFLGNARTWRGPTARRIKSELKSILGEK